MKYAAARSNCAEGRLGRKGRAHRFICPGLEVGDLGGPPRGKALLDNRQEASSEMAVEEKTRGGDLSWETGGQIQRRWREAGLWFVRPWGWESPR